MHFYRKIFGNDFLQENQLQYIFIIKSLAMHFYRKIIGDDFL